MKFITTTLAAVLLATSSFAGEVSMSSAAHLPGEEAMMGSGGAQWIIPLIAIALIALIVSSDGNSCKVEKVKIKVGPGCFPS